MSKAKYICQLQQLEQQEIRTKVINYLEGIEKGLAFKLDEFGNINLDNIMNDTISNLENMIDE
ncbi:hypothetical protein [uncultured Clostridium sp.]|uniref:hypothetical protein n=1 Tax=uncultured Clostridium sp. TaxID=59620 RepID=UPI0032164EBE